VQAGKSKIESSIQYAAQYAALAVPGDLDVVQGWRENSRLKFFAFSFMRRRGRTQSVDGMIFLILLPGNHGPTV
jgi:hypothetical protein